MLSEAGYTRGPDTWDELVSMGKKLTRPGRWGVSFPASKSAYTMLIITGLFWGFEISVCAFRLSNHASGEWRRVRIYLAFSPYLSNSCLYISGHGQSSKESNSSTLLKICVKLLLKYLCVSCPRKVQWL